MNYKQFAAANAPARFARPILTALSLPMGALAIGALLFSSVAPSIKAQSAPAAKSTTTHLEIAPGTKVSYRVQEQFAGVNFPTDAVGTTDTVTGNIVLAPDGSIDSSASKLSIDLRTLKSDQDMRDGYVKNRTLESDKFPMAEFVPRKVTGLPSPLPVNGQAGFELTGDMTIHGKTAPVTFRGVATFTRDQLAGRATTDFTFATFGLTKPTLARLLSVDDKIALELEFRMKKTAE